MPFAGLTKKVDATMDGIDRFQRSTAPLAVVNGVLKKFGDDRGSMLAKLVAYNGFFSMFPLLLATITVLDIILRDNPELRRRLVESTLSSIPVLGTELSDTTGLSGSGLVLVVSLLVAFWAGLGLLNTIAEVFNVVWNVPRFERPGWLPRHARAAVAALVIVLCAGISGIGNYVLGTSVTNPWRSLIGAVFPLSAGAAASLLLHRVLCKRRLGLRDLLPAAIGTALGWWGLFSLGNFYFNRVVRNASDTYGAFAVVLGLLSWSHLLAMMFVYATELSAVLSDRLWPRSMTGRFLTNADQRALEIAARRQLSNPDMAVSIETDVENRGSGRDGSEVAGEQVSPTNRSEDPDQLDGGT